MTQEVTLRRIATVVAVSALSFAGLAGTAAADPVATFCGSISVTLNGESVVDQSQCQVLPPEGQ